MLSCAGLGNAWIQNVMNKNRFERIKANIRFAEQNDLSFRAHSAKGAGRYKRLWKTQRLLDAIRTVSQENFIPGTEVALDEMLVFTKGVCWAFHARLRMWHSLVCCLLAQQRSVSRFESRGNRKEMDY